MTERAASNVKNILGLVLVVISILATTGGWWRRAGQIEEKMSTNTRDIVRVESVAISAYEKASDNRQGVAVINATLNAGFSEIMRRLDRIEEAQKK